jgi:hypothetical protein
MTDKSLKDDQNKLDQLAKSWSRLVNLLILVFKLKNKDYL